MVHYWFSNWLKVNRIVDEASLEGALSNRSTLYSLLEAAPGATVASREGPPHRTELTAGKGIDLTGELGCRHIDCLTEEVDSLFRHAWHYFDIIRLPDQALTQVTDFGKHNSGEYLFRSLLPFFQILRLIESVGAQELVEFEIRTPSCPIHLDAHARDANVEHAFANTGPLVEEIADSAQMTWSDSVQRGHRHLDYQLDHPEFEHTEWGSLCGHQHAIPEGDSGRRDEIARDVVRKYLAGLSADALAARRSKTALGTNIPFYRRLLTSKVSERVGDVAFELELPVSADLPIAELVRLRTVEREAFSRFQSALTIAISERLNAEATEESSTRAHEIQRDVIDPELRRIRDTLAASQKFAIRGMSTGIGLGAVAATIGLFTPLAASPIGIGLTVGGAVTLVASSLKKANDDILTTIKDVSLSDMFFLWKAHQHSARVR